MWKCCATNKISSSRDEMACRFITWILFRTCWKVIFFFFFSENMNQKGPHGILYSCIDCRKKLYWWPMNGTTGDGGIFCIAIYLSTFQARSPSLNIFTRPTTTQHAAGNERHTHINSSFFSSTLTNHQTSYNSFNDVVQLPCHFCLCSL